MDPFFDNGMGLYNHNRIDGFLWDKITVKDFSVIFHSFQFKQFLFVVNVCKIAYVGYTKVKLPSVIGGQELIFLYSLYFAWCITLFLWLPSDMLPSVQCDSCKK